MPVICPAVLARDEGEYQLQMSKIAHVAHRIQIDLSDGLFAPSQTVSPEKAWWPAGVAADFHLMFSQPMTAVQTILAHKPNLIIVHAESDGDFSALAGHCRQAGVKVGVALLPGSSPEAILPAIGLIDHVMIFSGELGHYGGLADLTQLSKAAYLKQHKPSLEIGWDGGINDQNVAQLVYGGIDVLVVGGFIQKAENPEKAYQALQRIADETGTT